MSTLRVELTKIDSVQLKRGHRPLSQRKIKAYASRLTPFPPIKAILQDGVYWIVDGHHRFEAAKVRGDISIEVEV